MRILITGYNGFIGRHLTKQLLNDGHIVFGIDNFSNSQDDWDFLENQSVEIDNRFYNFDIKGDESYYKLLSEEIDHIDVIFHFAAKARVQPSFENPVAWHDTNVTGTLKLLEFAKVNKIKKFIFSSSSSVYGISGRYGQTEHSKLHPMSPYALQKIQAEQLCEFYGNLFGIQTICLRYFNVYGENQPITGNYPQLVPILLDRFRKNQSFTIFGDGETRRDYTYVGDVVKANVLAMESKETGIFNIGSGVNYSVNEIREMIDSDHMIDWKPGRIEPASTLAINYKAWAKLGWKPTIKLPEWIKSQI